MLVMRSIDIKGIVIGRLLEPRSINTISKSWDAWLVCIIQERYSVSKSLDLVLLDCVHLNLPPHDVFEVLNIFLLVVSKLNLPRVPLNF